MVWRMGDEVYCGEYAGREEEKEREEEDDCKEEVLYLYVPSLPWGSLPLTHLLWHGNLLELDSTRLGQPLPHGRRGHRCRGEVNREKRRSPLSL